MAPVTADALPASPSDRGRASAANGAPAANDVRARAGVSARATGNGRGSRDARFVARAVALASRDGDRDSGIGDLLGLIARTAGAADVAVAVDYRGHRIVIARAAPDEPGAGGEPRAGAEPAPRAEPLARAEPQARPPELARWLDAAAPRGARGRAPLPAMFVTVARTPGRSGEALGVADGAAGETLGAADGADEAPRRWIALPVRGRVAIGFVFRSPHAAAALGRRFPPSLSRPAGSILAWLVRHREAERELAELRQADTERRRFVSVVAHELRTPLSSLGGYLDLVAAARNADLRAPSAGEGSREEPRSSAEPSDGPDPQGEFLARSRDLVAGMATLVADLLELSRLDAGQLHLSPAPFSGAETAQAAVHDLAPLAMERGIALDTALPSRLRTVHADRRRVQQILVNLLGNAIKFSPPSSRVALSLHFDGPVALYTVRDQGPGVPPDERSLIFEPFHRAAGAERIVGTGLGLPIARDLARRMGGDLDVASAAGSGSAFVVALPATESTAPALVAAALAEAIAREEAGGTSPSGRLDQSDRADPSDVGSRP